MDRPVTLVIERQLLLLGAGCPCSESHAIADGDLLVGSLQAAGQPGARVELDYRDDASSGGAAWTAVKLNTAPSLGCDSISRRRPPQP